MSENQICLRLLGFTARASAGRRPVVHSAEFARGTAALGGQNSVETDTETLRRIPIPRILVACRNRVMDLAHCFEHVPVANRCKDAEGALGHAQISGSAARVCRIELNPSRLSTCPGTFLHFR